MIAQKDSLPSTLDQNDGDSAERCIVTSMMNNLAVMD